MTIVGNLVDNALDALGGRGGRIDVRVAAQDDEVVLRVRDDGPGIPADALAHVFEAGWSTKPETSARPRGLGLALVSATATRLGGTVDAANDGGAVITVRLPVRSGRPVEVG